MKTLLELGILFLVSLASEAIAAALPFEFPPAILAMFMLLLLLSIRAVKEVHLENTSAFFARYMALFFIPAGVEIINYLDLLKDTWFYIILIAFISLLTTFFAAAKAVELTEKLMQRKENR